MERALPTVLQYQFQVSVIPRIIVWLTDIWNFVDAPNQIGKTAQVSAVPRTKLKVSGGTQTCSSDLQQGHSKLSSFWLIVVVIPNDFLDLLETQYKSYSLTGNTATQLSQSVRERLLMGSQSLPKGATVGPDFSPVLRQARIKASDGSLSDTQATEATSPYASWLRHR